MALLSQFADSMTILHLRYGYSSLAFQLKTKQKVSIYLYNYINVIITSSN